MSIKDIGSRLESLVKARQETAPKEYAYAAIGRRLGVSRETVRSWCAGESAPRLDKLDALAADLGAHSIYILFGLDDAEPPEGMVRTYLTPHEAKLIQMLRAMPPEQRKDAEAYFAFLASREEVSNVVAIPHRRSSDRNNSK